MKLIFLCSSLEKGRDGVGDYTRRLSGELIRQGHKVSIIALHDRHINNIQQEYQIDQNSQIDALRLPSCISWNKRIKIAEEYVSEFNPEWLSLQYVPFGFHDKGLPFLLEHRLKKVGQDVAWHIMFHELWVGMEENTSIRFYIWGFLQKKMITSMCRVIHPKVTHTHSALYKQELVEITNSKILPLFSNIYKEAFVHHKNDSDNYNVVVFGHIHYGAPVESFIIEFKKYTSSVNKSGKLNFIGHNGNELDKWVKICELEGVEVAVYGRLNPEKVSNLLHQADLGICTTPFWLTEKSGIVAAYKEHSLRTLCVAREWNPKGSGNLPVLPYVSPYEVGELEAALRLDIPIYKYNLSIAAKQFLEDLTLNNG